MWRGGALADLASLQTDDSGGRMLNPGVLRPRRMPLLLIPLVLVAIVVLWALLLPIALVQRYRAGKARRRALMWLLRLNTWLLLLSTAIFLFGAAVADLWVDLALLYAIGGWSGGVVLAGVGVALTRIEHMPEGSYYTPNRWLALGLTLVVAARIGYGIVRAWQMWRVDAQASWLAQQGGVLAVGGLLLGYYLAYNWAIRRRAFGR